MDVLDLLVLCFRHFRHLSDLAAFFGRVVPEDVALYCHNDEGPDDMPAHIKSALTQTQLTIPVSNGRLQLGTWQQVILIDFDNRPRSREIVVQLIGGSE